MIAKTAVHTIVIARPRTGRTHQIRVHAAENGFPIDGDKLYGGSLYQRLCLHARRIEFTHPVSNDKLAFEVAEDFYRQSWLALRDAVIARGETNAYRFLHGEVQECPELDVDLFGPFALVQSQRVPTEFEWQMIDGATEARGFYQLEKLWDKTQASRQEAI